MRNVGMREEMKHVILVLLLLSSFAAWSQEPKTLQPLSLFDISFAHYWNATIQQLSYPSNDALVVYCFPAHRKEWMISLGPGEVGSITFAEAEQRVWQSASQVSTNVTIRRIEKHIPPDTAQWISQRWTSAVTNSRFQADLRQIRDGEIYWFVINGDTVGTCSNPSKSSEPGRLVEMALLLRNVMTNTGSEAESSILALEELRDK